MSSKMEVSNRYNGIDGIRAWATLGIVAAHVRSNGYYEVSGVLFEKILPAFLDLVYLFMVVSAFSMCCGYYDKIIEGKESLSEFYKKRYKRIWPFFAILCVLEFVLDPNIASFYELFANLTLAHGFIPNAYFDVIGVGWFLGVLFVFYMIFPFFCFLMEDCKRAWASFAATVVLNYSCVHYFTQANDKSIFAYSAMFFVAGGVLYKYRGIFTRRERLFKVILWVSGLFLFIYCYFVNNTALCKLIISMLVVIGAMNAANNGLLSNKISKLVSKYSMEIYLCHMIFYHVFEKLGVERVVNNEVGSYMIMLILTFSAAMTAAVAFDKVDIIVKGKICKR